MTLEVGGTAETVNVTAEAVLVQTQSGENAGRANQDGARRGGVSQDNLMMDGISAVDTGNNGQMLNMNIESIGEIKVLTLGYQAEYGRSSGLQHHGGDQERHERVPRVGLVFHRLGLAKNSWVRRRTATDKAKSSRQKYDWRPVRRYLPGQRELRQRHQQRPRHHPVHAAVQVGSMVYNQREFYVQDNWKVTAASRWTTGCGSSTNSRSTTTLACSGKIRNAMDPRNAPNTHGGKACGRSAERHCLGRQRDREDELYLADDCAGTAGAARVGFAYDLTGKSDRVIRGGGGLFYDRPDGNTVFSIALQPLPEETMVGWAGRTF